MGVRVFGKKKNVVAKKKKKRGCGLVFYFGVRATFRARGGVPSRVRFSCLRAISSG